MERVGGQIDGTMIHRRTVRNAKGRVSLIFMGVLFLLVREAKTGTLEGFIMAIKENGKKQSNDFIYLACPQ